MYLRYTPARLRPPGIHHSVALFDDLPWCPLLKIHHLLDHLVYNFHHHLSEAICDSLRDPLHPMSLLPVPAYQTLCCSRSYYRGRRVEIGCDTCEMSDWHMHKIGIALTICGLP